MTAKRVDRLTVVPLEKQLERREITRGSLWASNIPMFQDNTDPARCFCEDIRDARVQEGQPILAAYLSCVNYNHRPVGTRDVMSLVDPKSLLESGRVLREVIEGLCEPFFRKAI